MKPVVLIGPSGAGKSTIARDLVKTYGFTLVRTVTTRPPRDLDDDMHEFVSDEEFARRRTHDEFIGLLDAFGAHYGLPNFTDVEKPLLLLRAPAIEQFMVGFPETVVVEIEAPVDMLVERLIARGDIDRANPELLEREMAFGRVLATLTLTSIDSPALLAEKINQQFIDAEPYASSR